MNCTPDMVQAQNYKKGKLAFIDDEILTQDESGDFFYTRTNKDDGIIMSYSTFYFQPESGLWEHIVHMLVNLLRTMYL